MVRYWRGGKNLFYFFNLFYALVLYLLVLMPMENWLRYTIIQIFRNKTLKDVRIFFNEFSRNFSICVALFAFKLFISFKVSSLSTNEKLKDLLELQFSLKAIMRGWALYLTIALITGSLMEADIGSCSLYCRIFRFWIKVEKKLFKTLAVSLSFLKILVPSTSVIFSR